nr:MAG TPA: hypothetical protein [Caudoviricetes sp.]
MGEGRNTILIIYTTTILHINHLYNYYTAYLILYSIIHLLY